MGGAARFLYGLALGASIGFIYSKLFAASSNGSQKRTAWNGQRRPRSRTNRETRKEVAAR